MKRLRRIRTPEPHIILVHGFLLPAARASLVPSCRRPLSRSSLVRPEVRVRARERKSDVRAPVDHLAAGAQLQEAQSGQTPVGIAWSPEARIGETLEIPARRRQPEVP